MLRGHSRYVRTTLISTAYKVSSASRYSQASRPSTTAKVQPGVPLLQLIRGPDGSLCHVHRQEDLPGLCATVKCYKFSATSLGCRQPVGVADGDADGAGPEPEGAGAEPEGAGAEPEGAGAEPEGADALGWVREFGADRK